jgi:hypothetical protein
MAARDALPLATLENCFRLLCAEPGALTIDGRLLPDGVLSQPIPLDELGGRIDPLPQEARRAVLGVLVTRAQAGIPTWWVALAGLLLPGLQVLADRLAVTDRARAEADALNWFRSTLALPAPAAVRSLQWLLQIASTEARPASTNRTAAAIA